MSEAESSAEQPDEDPRWRPTLSIQEAVAGEHHTLVLSGELDLAYASDLEAIVQRLCVDGIERLVLDIGQVSFIDSTGLRAVLAAKGLCREHECDFIVISAQGAVKRVFELTGMLNLLTFHEDDAVTES